MSRAAGGIQHQNYGEINIYLYCVLRHGAKGKGTRGAAIDGTQYHRERDIAGSDIEATGRAERPKRKATKAKPDPKAKRKQNNPRDEHRRHRRMRRSRVGARMGAGVLPWRVRPLRGAGGGRTNSAHDGAGKSAQNPHNASHQHGPEKRPKTPQERKAQKPGTQPHKHHTRRTRRHAHRRTNRAQTSTTNPKRQQSAPTTTTSYPASPRRCHGTSLAYVALMPRIDVRSNIISHPRDISLRVGFGCASGFVRVGAMACRLHDMGAWARTAPNPRSMEPMT